MSTFIIPPEIAKIGKCNQEFDENSSARECLCKKVRQVNMSAKPKALLIGARLAVAEKKKKISTHAKNCGTFLPLCKNVAAGGSNAHRARFRR